MPEWRLELVHRKNLADRVKYLDESRLRGFRFYLKLFFYASRTWPSLEQTYFDPKLTSGFSKKVIQ